MNDVEPVNILLVDDEHDNLLLLETILRAPHYILMKAFSGREALQRLQEQDFAVILLDVAMPEMDGFETARLVRERESARLTPIIFLTAHAWDSRDVLQGYTVGAVDYMFKPFVADILRSKVGVFAELYRQTAQINRLNADQQLRAAQLETANQQLETEIAERQQIEARQAQLLKQIAGINQDLNDFAHMVSQGLQAPLRAIGALADWLAADYASQLDPDGQAQLALLRQHVRRLHDRIGDLLQYVRTGREPTTQVELDMGRLAADVIETLAPPAETRMRIEVERPLPTVVGDPNRLRQVFHHLIGNAIKFMDKPEGKIVIGAAEQSEAWEFWVADDGPGIAAQNPGKVFQPFASGDLAQSGLGLALVKKIVEGAGGRVWAESTVGEGSAFFFTLPKPAVRG